MVKCLLKVVALTSREEEPEALSIMPYTRNDVEKDMLACAIVHLMRNDPSFALQMTERMEQFSQDTLKQYNIKSL